MIMRKTKTKNHIQTKKIYVKKIYNTNSKIIRSIVRLHSIRAKLKIFHFDRNHFKRFFFQIFFFFIIY